MAPTLPASKRGGKRQGAGRPKKDQLPAVRPRNQKTLSFLATQVGASPLSRLTFKLSDTAGEDSQFSEILGNMPALASESLDNVSEERRKRQRRHSSASQVNSTATLNGSPPESVYEDAVSSPQLAEIRTGSLFNAVSSPQLAEIRTGSRFAGRLR
jgi:hypothetical protein